MEASQPKSAKTGNEKGGTFYSQRIIMQIHKNWGLYLLILPAFILLVCFAYVPMYGVTIAFKNYLSISCQ